VLTRCHGLVFRRGELISRLTTYINADKEEESSLIVPSEKFTIFQGVQASLLAADLFASTVKPIEKVALCITSFGQKRAIRNAISLNLESPSDKVDESFYVETKAKLEAAIGRTIAFRLMLKLRRLFGPDKMKSFVGVGTTAMMKQGSKHLACFIPCRKVRQLEADGPKSWFHEGDDKAMPNPKDFVSSLYKNHWTVNRGFPRFAPVRTLIEKYLSYIFQPNFYTSKVHI
jgi:hypothetical protein